MTLKAMLENSAVKYARKTAIVLGERRISYAELDEASNKVANALIAKGLRKGDRVIIMLPDGPDFVTFYFGICKAGGIAIPLDIRLKLNELTCLLENCRPKILVTEATIAEAVIPSLSCLDYIKHIINTGSSNDTRFLSYSDILISSSAQRINTKLAPDDIATISYAGGPTNHPLGVMLSHYSLTKATSIYARGFHQTDNDVVMLFSLPMYHVYGLAAVLLTSIYAGSTVVVVTGTGRSIGTLLETIEREKGTMFLGVPYIYALATNVAMREGVKNNLNSLRLCVSAGAPLTTSIIDRFKQYYNFDIIDMWGLTESVAQVTCPDTSDRIKPGSQGKALPGWEIKAVDNNGNELPSNQPGEIIVKGLIMKGYYHNHQATTQAIQNDWLHTGDIGRIDQDGYLFLTGRKKTLIISKGQNVFPSDIEEVLQTNPKIAEVKVIGVPDELRGEIIKAIVVLKDGQEATEQEIRDFCRQRMSEYKLPKHVVFADALPRFAIA
ncbi:class I adenylate-forming enzyme family protein [Chloroflexota bacterium]